VRDSGAGNDRAVSIGARGSPARSGDSRIVGPRALLSGSDGAQTPDPSRLAARACVVNVIRIGSRKRPRAARGRQPSAAEGGLTRTELRQETALMTEVRTG